MNDNQIPSSVDARDYFLILRELFKTDRETIDLVELRSTFPVHDPQRILSRINLLNNQLNIPEDSINDVIESFASVLAEATDLHCLSKKLFLNLLDKKSLNLAKKGNFLKQYEHKALRLLNRSTTGFSTKKNDDKTDFLMYPWLDVKPIVRTLAREIVESPVWTKIDSPIPGIPDLLLEDTWVNLTLRELHTQNSQAIGHLDSGAWNELFFDKDGVGISLSWLLSKLQGLNVITGLPGAGKSTLMKWIARYLITEPSAPFGIPIFISLRQFAKDKLQHPDLSLFDYFLKNRGIVDESQALTWRSVAAGLLDPYEEDSDTPETFLWLLDGWDEVPPEMKYSILPEIQAIALYPSIITTRHSADVLRLPAQKYYEIQGLKHGAALELAHRWLSRTGRSAYFAAIEIGLEESADMRRMARNPFLLTLLCALASNPTSDWKLAWLPKQRSLILGETLKLIFNQHNADLKQREKFSLKDSDTISKFAYWLLADAPGGPRFVFDSADYENSTQEKGRFESLLVPSRLIAKPSIDSTDFQFLHATFQEYLAANNLLSSPDRIPSSGKFLFDQNWKEVARFLAEMVSEGSEAWTALWREVRQAIVNIDDFGIITSRIAVLVAAAGERDGGKRLVGIDLRDHLWTIIERYSDLVPTPLLEAFLELDPADFARRILDHRIKTGKNSTLTSWLELISIFDLEMLFTDHQEYQQILALPEVAVFCSELPDWLFGQSEADGNVIEVKLVTVFRKAVSNREISQAKTAFWDLINNDLVDSATELLEDFTKFPAEQAAELLFEFIASDQTNDIIRANAISTLIRLGERAFTDRLMMLLASKEVDDPAVFPILGGLADYPLNTPETRIIFDFVRHSSDSQTRFAGVELISNSRSRDAAVNLIAVLDHEPDDEVRLEILRALGSIADDLSLDKLWNLYENDKLRNKDEIGLWYRAMLITLNKRQDRVAAYPNNPSAASITFAVLKLAEEVLSSKDDDKQSFYPEILLALLEFPNILSRTSFKSLVRIAEGRDFPEETRIAAIHAVVKIDENKSIDFLKRLAQQMNDLTAETIRQAACDALGSISPPALAAIISKNAKLSMARLAFRFNILFMKNKVIDIVADSLTPVAKAENQIIEEFPFKADVGVFIALPEEFTLFQKIVSKQTQSRWGYWDDPDQSFTYYAAKIQPTEPNSEPVSLVAVCAAEMGPQRATNVSAALIDRFSPKSLVVIGIAGSLDNDVRLGDILVPNEVYSYLENSAAEDKGDSWDFVLSGKHYACDAHLLNQVRQFSNKHTNLYQRWIKRVSANLTRQLGKEKLEQALNAEVTRKHPRIVAADNHLATGSVVGKSTAFASWIEKNNRKVSAMEMETAAAFDAAKTRIENCRILAIRGISDFADDRKSKVEKDYKNKFRTISMINAVEFFTTLINAGIFKV